MVVRRMVMKLFETIAINIAKETACSVVSAVIGAGFFSAGKAGCNFITKQPKRFFPEWQLNEPVKDLKHQTVCKQPGLEKKFDKLPHNALKY